MAGVSRQSGAWGRWVAVIARMRCPAWSPMMLCSSELRDLIGAARLGSTARADDRMQPVRFGRLDSLPGTDRGRRCLRVGPRRRSLWRPRRWWLADGCVNARLGAVGRDPSLYSGWHGKGGVTLGLGGVSSWGCANSRRISGYGHWTVTGVRPAWGRRARSLVALGMTRERRCHPDVGQCHLGVGRGVILRLC